MDTFFPKSFTAYILAAILVFVSPRVFAQQAMDLVSGAAAIEQVESVAQMLDYSEAELADINAMIDGDGDLDSPGIFALLRRSCMASGLEDELIDTAAIVPVAELTGSPARFRSRLILLHLDIYKITAINTSVHSDRWWGRRAAWRLDCLERASGKPFILMVSKLPGRLTVGEYPKPVRVSTTALFAKVVRLKRSDNTGSELYPLAVACEVHPSRPVDRSKTGKFVFYILVLMLVAWWVLNKRIRDEKLKARAKMFNRSGDLPPTGDFDSAPVNEDLVQEIKKFQSRQSGDGE